MNIDHAHAANRKLLAGDERDDDATAAATPAPRLLPCVIYAAKSTEDLRGSIATQIEDCQRLIDTEGGRLVAGEFRDEAVSGYTRSRGQGLDQAMGLAAHLAVEVRDAELWVQHSDRLARGDGKTARHVVEIALWATKADVRVRCVQDPDTFRDLLYAVVTGQRNHEDSKRKGAASAAGIQRAAARGDYAGQLVDGYRVVVDADERGRVTKRMDFDPQRKPLFELIFRLDRRGDTPGVIARKVTAGGWRTVPRRRDRTAMPFDARRITLTLANPRYAGLSPHKGEILALAQWPAYISTHEYYERQAARRTRVYRPRHLDRLGFLLRRLAVCATCGSGMVAVSGPQRNDGTRSRRYVCRAHALTACKARPIDADIADHAIVAHLNALLGDIESQAPSRPSPGFPRERLRGDTEAPAPVAPVALLAAQLKHRIADALREDDISTADTLLAELVDHQLRFHNAVGRPPERDRRALPGAALGPRELLFEFYEWSAAVLAGQPTDTERTKRLNSTLRGWFESIEMRRTRDGVEMLPRYAPTDPPRETHRIFVHVGNWRVAMVGTGPGHRRGEPWTDQEILFALKTWALEHGRAPHSVDWDVATATHPHAQSVFKHLGTWTAALRSAGLQPTPSRPRARRSDEQILCDIRTWTRRHRRPPRCTDWTTATRDHPHAQTVYKRFGTWTAALEAAGAGPAPEPRRPAAARR